MEREMPSEPSGFRGIVLWLSFIESFGTILLERAIYFFAAERLGYSAAENLFLALGFGATYTLGAACSHGLSRRLGERAALGALLLGLLVLHGALALAPGGWLLPLGFGLVGLLEGAKWPIIESYVAAGLNPEQQQRAVGHFNVSWALAVPLAIASAGPLIASGYPAALFALATLANVLALALLRRLPARALHLSASHPSRPLGASLSRYRALLSFSRWSMLSSYTLLFLLAPLLPQVFRRLGCSVEQATLFASCLDAVRLVTFALLAVFPGWHGRLAPLFVSALGLPLGFGAIALGTSLPSVLAGEIIFGVLAGVSYYAALYYALLVQNASVDAGGSHEGLIGIGLVLGPAVGLLGQWLVELGTTYQFGMLAAALPFVLACWWGSLRACFRLPATSAETGTS
ncbi:MAG TPA: MFS transporter [Polyangiaceae bacterium]|nr:MFS transporter [Polyangiaceae bacterium]